MRIGLKFAGYVVLAAITAAPASAQSTSNEVWLGQVGGLNAVNILQEGSGNRAGADSTYLLLNQDGTGNALTLSQIGYNNTLGTLFGNVPDYARGVWQRGDSNAIEIAQYNVALDGANTIGAIQQLNAYSLPTNSDAYNMIDVLQTSDNGGGGIGGHYIGRLVQEIAGDDTVGTNSISIEQQDGGTEQGNSLADLRQIGGGNIFVALQTGQLQMIGERPSSSGQLPVSGAVQEGFDNSIGITQTGSQNMAEHLGQYGWLNTAEIKMDGSRNVLVQAYQNSESWGALATGNRISLSIGGSDNGGSGTGWVGELLHASTLAVPGVAQAVLWQLGDDNGLSITIIDGIDTKYGATQIGDSNGAVAAIVGSLPGSDAERNESAVFQLGNMNYVSHTITGDDNTAAIQQEGGSNQLDVSQNGQFNQAKLVIIGDDNNGPISSLFGSALTVAGAVTDVALAPGTVFQTGTGIDVSGQNTLLVSLNGGTANGFAFYQNGQANMIDATVSGTSNALVAVQENRANAAFLAQSGVDNSFGIYQF